MVSFKTIVNPTVLRANNSSSSKEAIESGTPSWHWATPRPFYSPQHRCRLSLVTIFTHPAQVIIIRKWLVIIVTN